MIDQSYLQQATLIYPQPLAMACGRILRAGSEQERLDATIRSAETLTRYLAVLAVSSFAARSDPAQPPPALFATWEEKALSFGDFLSMVQVVAGAGGEHPLRTQL